MAHTRKLEVNSVECRFGLRGTLLVLLLAVSSLKILSIVGNMW